jgi:hypothetical protein
MRLWRNVPRAYLPSDKREADAWRTGLPHLMTFSADPARLLPWRARCTWRLRSSAIWWPGRVELRPTIDNVCRNSGYTPPILCTPDELMGG